MGIRQPHSDGGTREKPVASAPDFSIGELATLVGVTAETIRYYEREQVIPRAPREGTGRYRRYTRADASRLTFVKHARDLGFTLDDVRALTALDSSETQSQCEDVGSIARTHLERVQKKLQELTLMQARLTTLVENCSAGRDGHGHGCGILAMLDSGVA
ncbi:MAG: MerR family transcriptional regulator [Gemmatimonadaceae bacterium]|nr:MerR family transcriptional regulator [Gemmatimonadaceae bacterium]